MFPIVVLVMAITAGVCGYFLYRGRNTFDASKLRGKRVLVTGASGDIGEKLAFEYARAGARLVLSARRESQLQRVVRRCRKLGAEQAEYVAADFSNADDRSRVVRETQRLLGGLDHLVLDHALHYKDFWKGSERNMSDLQSHLNVNVVAYVDVASKCLDMLAESGGNIGVVSSIDGKIALPKGGTHTISKFALQKFFSTLRQELAQRNVPVSVTLCVLGPIATTYQRETVSFFGMHAATVEETARAIVRGVAGRAVEIYHPASTAIAIWAHKFFPRTVELYTFACLEKCLQPASSNCFH